MNLQQSWNVNIKSEYDILPINIAYVQLKKVQNSYLTRYICNKVDDSILKYSILSNIDIDTRVLSTIN